MSVLKVMFSAIVTAMIGIFYLSWIGWLDLSLVYLTPTYIVPQITGGLILGIGFVIGGYCPGTSCVAVSTGKLDAIAYLVGVILGVFVFGELYPLLNGFANSTFMSKITIPQFFNIPYGLVLFLVVLMAVGAFAAAEWGEKKISGE
jgi:uncharacterized membrane protein YedE/YeeE